MGLLGSADENLRALERLLAADLHVRGNAVTLSGDIGGVGGLMLGGNRDVQSARR